MKKIAGGVKGGLKKLDKAAHLVEDSAHHGNVAAKAAHGALTAPANIVRLGEQVASTGVHVGANVARGIGVPVPESVGQRPPPRTRGMAASAHPGAPVMKFVPKPIRNSPLGAVMAKFADKAAMIVTPGLEERDIEQDDYDEYECADDNTRPIRCCLCCFCCDRLMHGILFVLAVAPICFLFGFGVLVWSEHRAACRAFPYDKAIKSYNEVNCTDAPDTHSGELVLMRCLECGINSSTLVPREGLNLTADFDGWTVLGTGLRTHVEMYQCVEEVETYVTHQKLGGDLVTREYRYKKRWHNFHVDSSKFKFYNGRDHVENCGANSSNPSWEYLPKPGTVFSESVQLNGFKLSQDVLRKIPLNTFVSGFTPPPGWVLHRDTYYTDKLRPYATAGDGYKGQYNNGAPTTTTTITTSTATYPFVTTLPRADVSTTGAFERHEIGDVRVTFLSHNPLFTNDTCTIMGMNDGGTLRQWTADGYAGCKDFSVALFRTGDWPIDEIFASVEIGADSLTISFRFCCFFALWLGFCAFTLYCGVAGVFLPCLGIFVLNMIEPVAAMLAFWPAVLCCVGLMACVWVLFNPWWAIAILPMLGLMCLMPACYFHARSSSCAESYSE